MTTTEERVSHLEGAYAHLATKGDIGDLKAEMGELRAEMGELRARMSDLRADLTREMGSHLKWIIGLQLAGLTAVAAIVRFLT